jgi:DNA modification methylase
MMSYQLLQGDCVEVMRTLPAGSVQCCVTSPPYFGLRDYGTAEWEGGDAACDHILKPARNDISPAELARRAANYGSGTQEGSKVSPMQYRDICGKCGARRIDRQIGLEETSEAYVAKLVEVFREVRRLLRDDGTLWLNLGDSYNGSGGAGGDYAVGGLKEGQPKYPGRNVKGLGPKQLLGIPWRTAFALQSDGWILRSEIIWHKRAPMPESVTDRPTKAHEQVFLLSKQANYFYDA